MLSAGQVRHEQVVGVAEAVDVRALVSVAVGRTRTDGGMADIVSGALAIDNEAAEGDPNVKGPWTNVTVDYIQ